MPFPQIFLGIDIGTGGVRCLTVSATGEILARSSAALALPAQPRQGAEHEQPIDAWWQALCTATRELMGSLRRAGGGGGGAVESSIAAVSIDGTSGTVVFLDANAQPLRPAMMYNDGRATQEAAELNARSAEFCAKLGYSFAASFALAKILWVRRHEPAIFNKTRWIMHQSDYLESRLTGVPGVSDFSNALKTGYDLIEDRWPAWLGQDIVQRLPRIVAPGKAIGAVTNAAATATGLPAGLPVVTGASDGTAGFLASGARRPGDFNTTLGTTLVFKGLSRELHRHPQGLLYSHKLPGEDGQGSMWLPGAASNAGCEWITRLFPNADLKALDAAAATLLPSRHISYPLMAKGERFPFLSPAAAGFCAPEAGGNELYAANLQGIAFVERLGYEVIEGVTSGTASGAIPIAQSAVSSTAIITSEPKDTADSLRSLAVPPARRTPSETFSTGGGSQSDLWMQCRADVTGRVFHRPACPESAFGAAVLAAAGSSFPDVWQAMGAMIRIEKTFTPRAAATRAYAEHFERFKAELRQRGCL